MQCPFCGSSEHKVVDKRSTPDKNSIRRRRACLKCEKRFTSYERIELANLMLVKKDGSREIFDRKKLQKGIFIACQKRPVGIEEIEQLIDKVETDVRSRDESEVSASVVGKLVMKRLKKLDEIAYIRFASVYREFKDIEEFQKELSKLNKKGS
jgi:transcriptional repressor NrdR